MNLLNGHGTSGQGSDAANQLEDLPGTRPIQETGLIYHGSQSPLFQSAMGVIDGASDRLG